MFHAVLGRMYLCLSKPRVSQKTDNGTGTLDIWSKNSFSPVHGGSSSISSTVSGASTSIAIPTPPTPSTRLICFHREMATWQHLGQSQNGVNCEALTTKRARNRQSGSDVVGERGGTNPRRTTNPRSYANTQGRTICKDTWKPAWKETMLECTEKKKKTLLIH